MPFDVGTAVGYLDLNTSGWSNGLKSAQGQLSGFNGQMSKAQSAWNTASARMTSTGLKLTAAVTTPIIGLGAKAVKASATFESAMATVQATMGATADSMDTLDGQTVNTMDSLSGLAKELGASTKFSAVEAAEAINNMAMAGYSVQEIYDSLPSVLSLASAGALDLDYATQLVANGLNVMGLETSDATELSDKLAVTATKAYGSVSDFGEGLLVAGAQAKLANVGLTDTMTALGILGDNGISAGEGGTYLRNTLKNLYTPTTDAAKALAELGVETANDDGTLRDFQTVLQDLGGALDSLTPNERIKAMSRIFDTRTISAANALIANSGERWDELSASIDASTGSAENMANTQLNNLNGQLTILKSSLEGLAIAFGDLILPLIKKATGFIQKLVDKLNGLDESQKKQILKIAAIVAALGPALIVVGKVVTLLGSLGKVFSFITSPAGLIITLIGALTAGFIYLWENCEGFRNFFINLWDTLKSVVSAVVLWFIQAWTDVSTFFTDLWTGISDFFSSAWATITGFFTQAWDTIVSVWQTVADWFSENVIEPIKAFFAPLVEWFTELFTSIWDFIASVFTVIAGLAEGCVTIILRVWEVVSGWFDKHVITPIKNFFTKLWDGIKSAASNTWAGIKSVWNVVSGWFDKTVIQPVTQGFSNAWSSLKNGALKAWGGIKDVFSGVADWFKDKFSKAWQAVKDVFSVGGKIFDGIKEGIVSAFKTVVNAIITGINKVVAIPFNAINAVLNKVRNISILGVSPFKSLWSQDPLSVPQIPLLARGGVLRKGQVGLLEGDGAEAVVPLEQNTGWIKRISSELFDRFKALLDDSGLLKLLQTFAVSAEGMIQGVQQRGAQAQKNDTTVNNYYNFYSPKEIDPIQARKMMLQTAKQLALD